VECLQEAADDDLVARYRAGAPEALNLLLHRYRPVARSKARSYFLAGADADDVEQEGMIGLYKAVRDYRPERSPGFGAFAEMCVTRQVISAVRGANRLKHGPMDLYASIGAAPGSEDDDRSVEDVLDDHRAPDPAEVVCQREGLAAMRGAMRDLLSGLEVEVLALHVEGRSHREIGESLGRQAKSVDNALQRIRQKLERHLAVSESAFA